MDAQEPRSIQEQTADQSKLTSIMTDNLAKRRRRKTTSWELEILEDTFIKHNTRPSREARYEVAERTGMDVKAVQIWFQNRRQYLKRTQQHVVTNSSSDANQKHPRNILPNMSSASLPGAAATTTSPNLHEAATAASVQSRTKHNSGNHSAVSVTSRATGLFRRTSSLRLSTSHGGKAEILIDPAIDAILPCKGRRPVRLFHDAASDKTTASSSTPPLPLTQQPPFSPTTILQPRKRSMAHNNINNKQLGKEILRMGMKPATAEVMPTPSSGASMVDETDDDEKENLPPTLSHPQGRNNPSRPTTKPISGRSRSTEVEECALGLVSLGGSWRP